MTTTLMVQGTTSDAGKSTLVAGLCRVFARRGYRIAPFKPQNMALNSAVTPEGGEIGRAQALQATAAGVPPHTDFNPILLKPNSDTGAQVIIHGRAISNMEAAVYHDYKKVAMEAVLSSHRRLNESYDCVMVEGAGSPAEINLRENDIANMGFATEIKCPVIIIADIDKGGVFAHLIGTLMLLSEDEQELVKGFVINRFRGDIGLLQSGLDWLEKKTGKPVLGVLPYLHNLYLDAEDAVAAENIVSKPTLKVAVLLLPHISNHTDFDALRLNPSVDLCYVRHTQRISNVDLIAIPGSKNVISDLNFLYSECWDQDIQRHVRYGGKLIGICGGFQMLGEYIYDPLHIESTEKEMKGLGLAEFSTELTESKTLNHVCGFSKMLNSTVTGYEIHCGRSYGSALRKSFVDFEGHPDGVLSDGFISEDDQIIGTYFHGLFDDPSASQALLLWASNGRLDTPAIDIDIKREQQIDFLADACEQHLNIRKIESMMGLITE
ncbi:cobyric acid synthase [Veronia pacifica]|uniref:Cobyric acid synthase n=1 Tax=Veronia pacifica TaxID=1080227 RepID=A0A1C3ESY2_9GAMM|nr:cobyric acid synthase [Veronia pacifica]ODA36314.1 cobyric acid synthase CobQ [Veronia pacifica]